VTELTPAELRVLVAQARAERAERKRATDDAILGLLRAGGPSGTVRAICRALRVSPKRVVALRAVLAAERRTSAVTAPRAGPAAAPRAYA
jgi:hypothetical protein